MEGTSLVPDLQAAVRQLKEHFKYIKTDISALSGYVSPLRIRFLLWFVNRAERDALRTVYSANEALKKGRTQ